MAQVHMTIATDMGQLHRELAMCGREGLARLQDALDAEEQVVWMDEIDDGNGLTLVPRLCFG